MTIALAFLLSELKTGTLFQITAQVAGVLMGPIAGAFFLGMLVPFADTLVSEMSVYLWWLTSLSNRPIHVDLGTQTVWYTYHFQYLKLCDPHASALRLCFFIS